MRDALLDLLLGATCVACGIPGRLLCPGCADALPTGPRDVRPVRPDPAPPGLAPAFAAAEYADPLRRMILRHKEERAFSLATPLGRILAAVLRLVIALLPPGTATLLVPVPSRPGTVRARGHDPTGRIVGNAAGVLLREGHRVRVAPILRQRRPVDDQAGLDAAGRAANLRDAIAVRPGALRRLSRSTRDPVVAVVCDDVLTTGATAREAQRALTDVGLPVAAIAVVAATRRRHPTEAPRPANLPT